MTRKASWEDNPFIALAAWVVIPVVIVGSVLLAVTITLAVADLSPGQSAILKAQLESQDTVPALYGAIFLGALFLVWGVLFLVVMLSVRTISALRTKVRLLDPVKKAQYQEAQIQEAKAKETQIQEAKAKEAQIAKKAHWEALKRQASGK